MGGSSSKDADALTVGKTAAEATDILTRRLAKCRAAAADAASKPKLAERARVKALGVLNVVSAWSGSAGSRGALPLPQLLDASCRALWVLEACAEEGELVLNTILPQMHALAERAHGPKSPQAAAVLALLVRRAYDADEHLLAVRWGGAASALLLELKGEGFNVPEDARRKEGFMDSWENAPNLHLCEEGHGDMLFYLAYAHSRIPGQAQLAHAAADRCLGLLEATYGQCVPQPRWPGRPRCPLPLTTTTTTTTTTITTTTTTNPFAPPAAATATL